MMPHTEMPWYSEALATARIAAFMPGASPPDVSTPMRLMRFMLKSVSQIVIYATKVALLPQVWS